MICTISKCLVAVILLFTSTSCSNGVQTAGLNETFYYLSKGVGISIHSNDNSKIFDLIVNSNINATLKKISYQSKENSVYYSGPPVIIKINQDQGTAYQEGWFEHNGKRTSIYYIIRYLLSDNAHFLKMTVTVCDRHDKPKTELPTDNYWQNQIISNLKLELEVPSVTKQIYVEQHNPFDSKQTTPAGSKPYIELEEKEGSPYLFTESPSSGTVSSRQIEFHPINKSNYVRFYPLQKGVLPLSVIWNGIRFPDYAAYLRGKGIVARVRHADGVTNVTYDQDKQSGNWLDLGTFRFDEKSSVDITTERTSGALLIDAIRVGRQVQTIFNRHPDELVDGKFALFVKDFWRNYPIAMELRPGKAIVEFIKEPSIFMGGMGKTFEIIYSFGDHDVARKALYQPPEVGDLKKYQDSLHFSTATNPKFSALEKMVAKELIPSLDAQRSVGWRNWGDYQIGVSYGQNEDWGNLQYDLPYGLLVLYIRTRDPEVWHIAQASVYHLMDMDLVKYSPFAPKYNGSVHRKGEMHRSVSHVISEPVVPFNFAFRSLYLYYLLTGDPFALECTKMSVNNFLEFTINPSRIDFASNGDRDTAWILMGLVFGYEKFGDKKYLEAARKVVTRLLEKENILGRLPGDQPVWQGQMLEALIKYYDVTKDSKVQKAVIRHVQWLKEHAINYDKKNKKFRILYFIRNDGKAKQNYEWTEELNYLFLWLNSFAYVSSVTNEKIYMDFANQMFEMACKEQEKYKGPRFISSFLSFPYYYLERGSFTK